MDNSHLLQLFLVIQSCLQGSTICSAYDSLCPQNLMQTTGKDICVFYTLQNTSFEV